MPFLPFFLSFCYLLCGFSAATAGVFQSSLVVHPATGITADRIRSIQAELSRAAVTKRDSEWKNGTSLDKNWDDAVLLQLGLSVPSGSTPEIKSSAAISIVCKTCYLRGFATGELTLTSNYTVAQTIENVGDQLQDSIVNLTHATEDFLEDSLSELAVDLLHDGDLDNFEWPTFPFDFNNFSITAIPDANLRFTFDGLEMYMLLDTALSLESTYTLPLYSSNTPLGISISDTLQLGLTFGVDLILDAGGTIDVRSGIHLKLNDGFAIDIALFGRMLPASRCGNGGRFEFLPVIVESAGIAFKATLRVSMHIGLEEHTEKFPTIANMTIPSIGGGIVVSVFANVAELSTEVTHQEDEPDCSLGVAQSFQFALGAAAGATVNVGTETWGPAATTSIPIWYTELASVCAITRTASSVDAAFTPTQNTSAELRKRQDVSTTTLTTTTIYTGISCLIPGLVNCPASAQNTSQSTATSTLVTTIAFGEDATWPASALNTAITTIAFAADAAKLPARSGSPVSYIPPPPSPTATSTGPNKDDLHHVKPVSRNIIIGLTVGLGTVLLLGIVAGLVFVSRRRKRYDAVSPAVEKSHEPVETPTYIN